MRFSSLRQKSDDQWLLGCLLGVSHVPSKLLCRKPLFLLIEARPLMHLGYSSRLFDSATFVVATKVLDRTTRSRSLGRITVVSGWKDVTRSVPRTTSLSVTCENTSGINFAGTTQKCLLLLGPRSHICKRYGKHGETLKTRTSCAGPHALVD